VAASVSADTALPCRIFPATRHAACNARRDSPRWSDGVNQRFDEGATASGYVLSEETYQRLEKVRDQLFLIANFVITVTEEEEDVPLQVTRSAFGQCLEGFAEQIDDALMTAEWSGRSRPKSARKH
jgi:hypothetical protein